MELSRMGASRPKGETAPLLSEDRSFRKKSCWRIVCITSAIAAVIFATTSSIPSSDFSQGLLGVCSGVSAAVSIGAGWNGFCESFFCLDPE